MYLRNNKKRTFGYKARLALHISVFHRNLQQISHIIKVSGYTASFLVSACENCIVLFVCCCCF